MTRLLVAIAFLGACGDDTVVPATDGGSADATYDATVDVDNDVVVIMDATDGASACGACDGACLDGACVECAPGTNDCVDTDGGASSRTCNGSGTWTSTACAQPAPACDAGTCVCAGAVCGGTCIDVSSDSANCGYCGHDCCGGTCVNGACQAVVLAPYQSQVSGVVVDATDIYWASYTQIVKCSKASCTTPTVLVSNLYYPPLRPVLDASNVYWIGDGIWSCPKSGCTSPTKIWTPISNQQQADISDLTVIGTKVYFTLNGQIVDCLTSGCPGDGGTLDVLVSGRQYLGRIATDSTTIFWREGLLTNSTIKQCALSGCSNLPTTTTANAAYVQDLFVDATNLYWSGSALMRCSKTLCITPDVVTYGALPQFGQDDTRLYWFTSSYPTDVYACPKSGPCSLPAKVATSPTSPYTDIATDDACLYWGTTQQVVKAAKP